MKIVIVSLDWDYRFARPQQLARIFAERHRVRYLSTGPGIVERIRDVRKGNVGPRHLTERLTPNLQVSNALFPVGVGSPGAAADNCRLTSALFRLGMESKGAADVALVTEPLNFEVLRHVRYRRLVYDCLDRYEGFYAEGSPLRGYVRQQEKRLMAGADFVFASARVLCDEKSRDRPVHYLPHGVDVDYFVEHSRPRPDDMAGFTRKIAGFVGGIEHWVNLEWVAEAARRLPDVDFVLIGDVRTDIEAFTGLSNVHLLGYRPHQLVPAYIAAFDACMIPFRVNYLTAAVNPIKVLEYFALGKPVVSSYMAELERYRPTITLAEDVDGFCGGLIKALRDDAPDYRFARIELARSHSWRRIAGAMLDVVSGRSRSTGF
jgi:glycosyltransferase involved in cell wall biosynthesis